VRVCRSASRSSVADGAFSPSGSSGLCDNVHSTTVPPTGAPAPIRLRRESLVNAHVTTPLVHKSQIQVVNIFIYLGSVWLKS
jgi:hypothetical protein